MAAHKLELTAKALVAEGKGILATDERTGTMTKRLDAVDIESTGPQPREPNRAFYRRAQLLHAAHLGEYFEEVAA